MLLSFAMHCVALLHGVGRLAVRLLAEAHARRLRRKRLRVGVMHCCCRRLLVVGILPLLLLPSLVLRLEARFRLSDCLPLVIVSHYVIFTLLALPLLSLPVVVFFVVVSPMLHCRC